MAVPLTLSIVCPAYQEEAVLPRFHAALSEAVTPLAADYRVEVVYVDDGSRDGTLGVMRRLAAADGRVRFLALSRNFGKEAALAAGVEAARGDAVVTLDTDLQHPPRLIPELVARWRDGADVVLTVRAEDRRQSWFKRTTSRLFYRVLGQCSDVEVRPASTDFRLMSRPAVDALVRLREAHRYTPGLVRWVGFGTAEVPFAPDLRPGGQTKYGARALARLALDALLSFSPSLPRRAAAAAVGLTAAGWAVSVGAVAALAPLSEAPARLAVVGLTAVHALAAGGFAAAGLLGEYLARIYEQSKGRPVYLVKEGSAADAAAARARRAA